MLQLETSYRRQKSVGGTILCIKNKYFKSLRHLIVSKAFIYKCYMTVKAAETGPQRSGWLFSPAVETTVSTPASQIGLSAWHAWLQQRIPMSCYDASRGGAGDGSNAWIPIGHPGDLNWVPPCHVWLNGLGFLQTFRKLSVGVIFCCCLANKKKKKRFHV